MKDLPITMEDDPPSIFCRVFGVAIGALASLGAVTVIAILSFAAGYWTR